MVVAEGGGSVDALLGVTNSYSFDHNQHSDDDDYKAKCASSPYLWLAVLPARTVWHYNGDVIALRWLPPD